MRYMQTINWCLGHQASLDVSALGPRVSTRGSGANVTEDVRTLEMSLYEGAFITLPPPALPLTTVGGDNMLPPLIRESFPLIRDSPPLIRANPGNAPKKLPREKGSWSTLRGAVTTLPRREGTARSALSSLERFTPSPSSSSPSLLMPVR